MKPYSLYEVNEFIAAHESGENVKSIAQRMGRNPKTTFIWEMRKRKREFEEHFKQLRRMPEKEYNSMMLSCRGWGR